MPEVLMSEVLTFDELPSTGDVADRRVRLTAQTDMLIDAITGASREQLEQLPVPVIFNRLCAQLRGMGLEPAEAKVMRVARWISMVDPSCPTTGSAA